MAYPYYSSNFYEADSGEYYRTPYTDSYDIVPFQEPVTYSGYESREPGFVEYNSTAYRNAYDPYMAISESNYSNHSVPEPKLIEYNPNPYGRAYDSFSTRSEINYSTYSVPLPKLIEYDPNPYGTGYYSPETQYVISYSTKSDVDDDTEFEDYDPTPYGGGYDPALTYGRPLAPSDQICYPRSDLNYNVPSFDNIFFESIPSPYGQDDGNESSERPRSALEPTEATEEPMPPENPLESSLEEPVESHPWSGYGYEDGNERHEDYGFRNGYDKRVVETTCDYGIDALDLCESLFGHWPCLYKNNGRHYDGDQECECEEKGPENQWMGAADCLFGGDPYGNGRNEAGNYGWPTYNYEQHYREQ